MTEKEKYEFLKKTLKENGWEIECINTYNNYDSRKVIKEEFRACKKDVDIYIQHYYLYNTSFTQIFINKAEFFSVCLMNSEIFSDHMEFKYLGASVMVRLTDGYILMEFEPEKQDETYYRAPVEDEPKESECVTATLTNNLSG